MSGERVVNRFLRIKPIDHDPQPRKAAFHFAVRHQNIVRGVVIKEFVGVVAQLWVPTSKVSISSPPCGSPHLTSSTTLLSDAEVILPVCLPQRLSLLAHLDSFPS